MRCGHEMGLTEDNVPRGGKTFKQQGGLHRTGGVGVKGGGGCPFNSFAREGAEKTLQKGGKWNSNPR